MNRRTCVHHDTLESLRNHYEQFTDLYIESSNKFRLCILLGSENSGNFITDPTYDSTVLVHEVPTMFLTYRQSTEFIPTNQIFVAKPLLKLWWQDIDVWINLPNSIEKKLVGVSAHLYFLNFETLKHEIRLR